MKAIRKSLITAAALIAGVLSSSAAVTVQGWWHLDSTQPINDSSGNSRTFGSAYSTAPAAGGQMGALLIDNGTGGPLGTSGWTSTQCIRLGVGAGARRQSAMWGIGYNPPAQNYGIEIWVMPQENGIAGGSGGWIFSSGQGGGVAFRINAPSSGSSYIDAILLGTSLTVGYQVPINTNNWMHLALVDAGGITTFYTNGVPCGPSDTNNATASAGDVYIGTPSDNQAFNGYLDEARMFTFAAGAFSTNDLLLRPAGPAIIRQPQSATVWSGGAANFKVVPSFSSSLTYQWRRNSNNIPSATAANLLLSSVGSSDSGSIFDCRVTSGGISVTSSVATLTVVANNPDNVNAYRSLVTADSSLLAYFPVDGDTGTTVSNVKDAAHNGALELNATYDGQTNRAFGQRALSFNLDGDVQIPNNPAFEFPGGNGTIEALVYMSQATVSDPTIFAEGWDQSPPFYAIRASASGSSLIYSNETAGQITWIVPGGLVGKFVHLAFVIDHGTNLTPYINGQSLGTQTQTGFGVGGGPAWIGSVGASTASYLWAGTIDELAIYGSALSASTIATHYTKYIYGTNTAPPVIVSQTTGPKNLLAGGSPVLSIDVSGALPFTYQWKSNGVAIAGATSPSLTLTKTKTNFTATYSVTVANIFGTNNSQPIALTFVPPPTGYVATVMGDGPTAFWRLADSSGSPAADSAGGYDGAYASSGVTYGAAGFPGDPGAGVALNGTSGRAIVPYTPALNPPTGSPFTTEFWCKPNPYVPGSTWYNPLSSLDRPNRPGGWEWYAGGNYNGFEFHTSPGGYSLITGDSTLPTFGTWYYLVGVYDGTNLYLYVNGQLVSTDTQPPDGPYVPNLVKGLYIGSRSDDVRYLNGSIADVAFYSQALSVSQISNHWRYGWVPSQIAQQPAGVTNVEGSTITITAKASGVPNTYQWYKGSTALTAVNNFDGTAHYQGINSDTLTITQAKPSDSGLYHLVVINPLANSTSADAQVSIVADTTKPTVQFVFGLGTPNASGPMPYLVKVGFSKQMDPATAMNPANYAFSPGVTVNSVTLLGDVREAALGGDWRAALLATAGLTPGQKYSLTVTGVKDQAQTPNLIVSTANGFTAPVLTQGLLDWDYYYLGALSAGGPVSDLTANTNYPGAPQTNAYPNIFDTHAITGTGGDLNNIASFGSLGDNYGDSLSGWVTPTVSGNYTFFLASDDASELWLSTDDKPAGATLVAYETTCCHPFTEPPSALTSAPQPLVAGKKYFIQALHIEGGAGDWVAVAWRREGDTTASTNLLPIASQYLSAYAPVPAPKFNPVVVSGGKVTISWTGTGTLLESADLKTWSPVPGNPPNPYVVTPTPAVPQRFYRVVQ